jgi:hypothetical protein
MIGVLTASFSVGQIIGPIVAGNLAEGGRGFDLAILLAGATVTVGAIVLAAGAALGSQGVALTTRKRVAP